MLYKLAPVAFIGGSLVDRGGQNPIEAVRQGAVVLTGPHWQNFADAYSALISHRGAIVVRSAEEIASAARQLLSRRGRARRHAQPRQRGARHHLRRAAAHHRGAAALPPARGRPGACVLTSRPGGTATRPSGIADAAEPAGARSTAGPPQARYCARDALPVAAARHLRRQFHGRRHRQDAARHPSVRAPEGGRPRAGRADARLRRAPAGPLLGRTPSRYGARRRRRGAAAGARRADAGRARPPARARAPSRPGRTPSPSSSWTTACRTRASPRT